MTSTIYSLGNVAARTKPNTRAYITTQTLPPAFLYWVLQCFINIKAPVCYTFLPPLITTVNILHHRCWEYICIPSWGIFDVKKPRKLFAEVGVDIFWHVCVWVCVYVCVCVCLCVCVCVCSYYSISIKKPVSNIGRCAWSRSLRRAVVAARLMGLWVRNPPLAWRYFSWECCILSRRCL